MNTGSDSTPSSFPSPPPSLKQEKRPPRGGFESPRSAAHFALLGCVQKPQGRHAIPTIGNASPSNSRHRNTSTVRPPPIIAGVLAWFALPPPPFQTPLQTPSAIRCTGALPQTSWPHRQAPLPHPRNPPSVCPVGSQQSIASGEKTHARVPLAMPRLSPWLRLGRRWGPTSAQGRR